MGRQKKYKNAGPVIVYIDEAPYAELLKFLAAKSGKSNSFSGWVNNQIKKELKRLKRANTAYKGQS